MPTKERNVNQVLTLSFSVLVDWEKMRGLKNLKLSLFCKISMSSGLYDICTCDFIYLVLSSKLSSQHHPISLQRFSNQQCQSNFYFTNFLNLKIFFSLYTIV